MFFPCLFFLIFIYISYSSFIGDHNIYLLRIVGCCHMHDLAIYSVLICLTLDFNDALTQLDWGS